MAREGPPRVAIVDYGMGNLFSVRLACEHAGLSAQCTSDPNEVRSADAIVLPGVGAFGDAMAFLRQAGLADVIREEAGNGKPLLGVCLGLQLLMTESCEQGRHRGLGIIPGSVVRFRDPSRGPERLKVPHVGWNRVWKVRPTDGEPADRDPWRGTLLEETPEGTYMYFVHSYHAVPEDRSVWASASHYGQIEFCSSLSAGRIFACQFHPERSGNTGLALYRRFAGFIASKP